MLINKLEPSTGYLVYCLFLRGLFQVCQNGDSLREGPAFGIGIDLGTTYSCVGVWQNDGVEIITNDQGNRTTPSYVAFTDTQLLIGDAAYNQVATNPLNTVFGEGKGESDNVQNYEDEETKAAFENLKSRTYALTVPLRIIALRNSVPPLWIKNFIQTQGRRIKFRLEFRGNLEDIYSELSSAFTKGIDDPKSAVAADIVSLGDTWVSFAINKALVEPLQEVQDQDWFSRLPDKWKVYLRKNGDGKIDSEGRVCAAPYRWGSMVIVYRKSKFQKHKLAPIEDWADLWQTDLSGKISMVDSPREIVGAVLKYMGASYNTSDIDSEIAGGRNSVQENLAKLKRQVRIFDSVNYLKAFSVGDVWVAVGWSSDILPIAKRMSDVAVIVPKSGASLWADLWAIPAASSIITDKIGGRVRGPSPLVHQCIDFCLQTERASPFEKEIIAGASPSALERGPVKNILELPKNKPKLDTNLVAGMPPADILKRCEFLEPLSESALSDYQWLITSIKNPSQGENDPKTAGFYLVCDPDLLA